MKCGKRYDANYIFDSKEEIPHCTCGGIIRPDITLYEEGLPEEAVNGAIKAIREADLLIIGGTSLTVYPAASYINYFRGKHLIIINMSTTPADSRADLLIHEKIGVVFSRIGG